jgi:hypothetical protein
MRIGNYSLMGATEQGLNLQSKKTNSINTHIDSGQIVCLFY